ATDLGLDLLAELVGPALELIALEALLELGQLAAALRPGVLHHPLDDTLEVDVPQRPVEVVRAAAGPARLHAGEPADGLARARPAQARPAPRWGPPPAPPAGERRWARPSGRAPAVPREGPPGRWPRAAAWPRRCRAGT